jgi:hypothetical protein
VGDQTLIDALNTAEGWLWLRCSGPDGLVWLMARYHNLHGHPFIDLPDDARDMVPLEGHTVHKWDIVEVYPCHPPTVDQQMNEALWLALGADEEVSRG